jgi:hypothetical protein
MRDDRTVYHTIAGYPLSLSLFLRTRKSPPLTP